ncbi:MAG TPA: hypothetical protein DGG95_15565 [Cytophagales bacterium]|nr:hypothetical protein [Cytophagales bacterium]
MNQRKNFLCGICIMKRIKLWFFIILFSSVLPVFSQKQKTIKKNITQVSKNKATSPSKPTIDPVKDQEKVKDMIQFLAFMLNTLGSSTTSSRDKDVLITESYSKIFRDSKVQIEDDLDDERGVVTNKDVVDYLKDINFFFKDVTFELTIDQIEKGENAEHLTFYKVSLHRNLSGTTIDGKNISNSLERFIEVNYNTKDQDLKIVSIYTHELNEKEALINWWKQLSYEWHSLFRKKCNLPDSVRLSDIQKVTAIEALDLSGNIFIQSIEPLSKLKNLKSLNLSSTHVTDLSPIRNLTGLIELNLSNTSISDLLPLKYSTGLMKLNISNTKIRDIQILQRLPQLNSLALSSTNILDFTALVNLIELKSLNLSNTKFSDLSFIQTSNKLSELNISKTRVQDLSALQTLLHLEILFCDSTMIRSIRPLANLTNLKVLHADNTSLSDLQPVEKLPQLKKIYCDKTPIKKETAEAFMASHPNVSVVYDSHNLKSWWNNLSEPWKEVISKTARINKDPSDEELAGVGNIDSINISSKTISDLEPLRKLEKIKILIASKTSVQDLSPIKNHREIISIDLSETKVTDLSPLNQMTKLQVLNADRCKIADISGLQKIKSLKTIYCDETTINDINAQEFLIENPKCLIIYKTSHLHRWWRNLSPNWRTIFSAQLEDTTRESLHELVERSSFSFKETPVSDLSGLSEFIRLKELQFAGTAITEIAPLPNLSQLKSLHATNSPIQNIEAIGQLPELEDLDISNTPVEDPFPVWTLQKLKKLNCSGTQIKRLDGIEKLELLEEFDCSNTIVSKLVPLDYLHLKSFKCYNTKISSRTIEHFIASHPDCKIVYYR